MNCGFKAYRAEVVKALQLYGDLHRYIPILVQSKGFSVGEVKVKHHARRFGVSKYGFKRIPKGFFDLFTVLFLTKYGKRPMHFFAGVGSLFAGGGMALLLALSVLTLLRIDVPSLSLWLSAGFGILTGILLGAIGLLCELYVSLLNSGKKTVKSFRQYFGILIAGFLLFFLINRL